MNYLTDEYKTILANSDENEGTVTEDDEIKEGEEEIEEEEGELEEDEDLGEEVEGEEEI